jgi:hypothetical protein
MSTDIFGSHIQNTLFERKKDKAKTPEEMLEFCKNYIKEHDPIAYKQMTMDSSLFEFRPPPFDTYTSRSPIKTYRFSAQKQMSQEIIEMVAGKDSSVDHEKRVSDRMKLEVAYDLVGQMVKQEMITFKTWINDATYTKVIEGNIEIVAPNRQQLKNVGVKFDGT